MNVYVKELKSRLIKSYKTQPAFFCLRALFILALAVLCVLKRNFWTPDTLFIILLAVFVVLGQTRTFILRFAPFCGLLLVYESFRGIADDLTETVNIWPMINFDTAIFGQLPTITLQNWLWHGALSWYDFYFYFLYTIHFVAPLILAVVIWKLRPWLYWQYVAALTGLSFAAFITYVVFPAAPPWMASDMGLIDQIHRISGDVWTAMGISNFSTVYNNLSPNLVAAVPSLHSAYPLLFTQFVWLCFGFKKTWWVIFYPISMWIGVVYMGEHYVMDVVLGALYAVIIFYTGAFVFVRAKKRFGRLAPEDCKIIVS